MKIIPFPRECAHGLKSYEYTIKCYADAINCQDNVLIECGNVCFFQPMGLTLLASMTFSLIKDGTRKAYFMKPKNEAVLKYLVDQDFFNEFAIEGTDSNRIAAAPRSSSLGLRRLEYFDGTYLDQIPRWLRRNSHMTPEIITDVINTTVPEIINNVFDHSRSPIGCYICAQAYPKEKRLMLSTIDLGVGFLKTLRPKFPSLTNNADAIELAVQPRITSQSKIHNAGAGLDVLSGFLKEFSGNLEIISRNGRWTQDKTGSCRKSTLPFQFPGTCLNLTFDDKAIMDRFTPGDRYD